MTSLFIFRLDLRLIDNTALIECFKNSNHIIPCFIFDPKQIDKKKNSYFSDNCVQFMVESLMDLYEKTNKKLLFFHGSNDEVVRYLLQHKELKIENIFVNKDYTPFSIKRDKSIKKVCDEFDCAFHSFDDILLNPIDEPIQSSGKYYETFTPYLNKIISKKINKPDKKTVTSKLIKINETLKLKFNITLPKLKDFYKENEHINVHGGRPFALKKLKKTTDQTNYNAERSFLDYQTTHLSAYIKFGCVSIREVYWNFRTILGNSNDLIKQLYWRDFYYYIIYHYPETYTDKVGLKSTYENFPWSKNRTDFNKWTQGKTGFPIIDAAMRNMNATGYMPNRGRLLVANFLTKLLRIDWKMGEKYFAQSLVDYSVSNNLGNWQWVASIGADYQNRIYNPMTQSEKYDPGCDYIRKWIPEIANLSNREIHKWADEKVHLKYENKINYSKPMINYPLEYKKSKTMFEKYL